MLSDKEQKKEFKAIASKHPEEYYAVDVLKQEGFQRKQCGKCKKYFWTVNESDVCGDSSCGGGFRFINNSPAKEQLRYVEVWKKFSKMFKDFGYTPIKRYPVVARWNPTVDFTIASIAAFQPFVVSGEVKPPANPLVIPQFCLRFGDVDNVGITGSHLTGFVMIGQHMFIDPKEWNQNKVFQEIHTWLKKGLGLPNKEIIYHEDAWAGGGNFGPCMEFFSRGVELGNQVYMLYEQTPSGNKPLKLKVLDMGMGQERNAWFSQGSPSIYDATFPNVCKKLYQKTGIKVDPKLMQKFIPLAGYLNVDEVEDVEKAWGSIAKQINVSREELKKTILPLSAMYSIAEHSRSLLVALNDGGLPSNVGGGYNLRMIVRRALNFIDQYNWDLDINDIAEWHANEVKELFPELSENLEEVKKLLNVEKQKYQNTKQKSQSVVAKLIQEKITPEKLVEVYDSQGIQPEIIANEAKKIGKEIKVPDNFYGLVAAKHEKKVQEHETQKDAGIDTTGIADTKLLYYQDYKLSECNAKILKVVDNKVILDQTVFYPTAGGQLHDIGAINNQKVVDVIKQGMVIVHVVESASFKVGEQVVCKIDQERRLQLAKHHTSTHIVNAAARMVLGKHVNQAGAKKTVEKAHIDLTHYQSITEEELQKVEQEANRIIKKAIPIKKSCMSRNEAEKKYGFAIYQGGVPIGNELRIVDIQGIDVEACGGTHLDNTKEAGQIKILKASKISDGIIRIEFVAGPAAKKFAEDKQNTIKELVKILNSKEDEVVGRAMELFELWKTIVKKGKKADTTLKSHEKYTGQDAVEKVAEIFKTQPEFIVKTAERFVKEIKEKE
ncbi:alanine--tRNA ligase [Candidatus Woesearchaeota archaeon]|nr:alanine--tRNA ligase [Candidatus Woesearchaeota archaeon]